ncbi:hypothetical protein V8F06_011149 [Rhypophila decipiens]
MRSFSSLQREAHWGGALRSKTRDVKSHVVLEANNDLGSDSTDSRHEVELIRAVKKERARSTRSRARQHKIEPGPGSGSEFFTAKGPPPSNQRKDLDTTRYPPEFFVPPVPPVPPPVDFEEESIRPAQTSPPRARPRQKEGRRVKWSDIARESRGDDGGYGDEDPPGLDHVFEWRNNVRPGAPIINSDESSGEQVVVRRHRRPTSPPDDVKAQWGGEFGKGAD